jgi:hypothetical protein
MLKSEILSAVHSGRRLAPPEIAKRLSEHFPKLALTPREVEVLSLAAETGTFRPRNSSYEVGVERVGARCLP